MAEPEFQTKTLLFLCKPVSPEEEWLINPLLHLYSVKQFMITIFVGYVYEIISLVLYIL